MGKITVTIHKGKITASGEGYKGSACQGPISAVLGALGGQVTKNELTAEGALPDEPLTNEGTEEVLA